jgi:hypothetical protein
MSEYERMTAYRAAKEAEALDWPERYERLELELAATKADLRRFEEGYWCRGDPDEVHYCTKCDNSVRPERYPIAYRCPHGTDTVHGQGCDACALEYERANTAALNKSQGSA